MKHVFATALAVLLVSGPVLADQASPRAETVAAPSSAATDIPSEVRNRWHMFAARNCITAKTNGDAMYEICLSQVVAQCQDDYKKTGPAQTMCRVN